MTSAETIAQIKDIVAIVFMVIALIVLIVGSILGIRLYSRVGRYMNKMERFADGFETPFGNIATARKALSPVVRGLGLAAALRGIGRFFGRGKQELDNESS